jgi:hypothetical protein
MTQKQQPDRVRRDALSFPGQASDKTKTLAVGYVDNTVDSRANHPRLRYKSARSFSIRHCFLLQRSRLPRRSAFRPNGFACVCSNFGGLVTRSSNRFTLPRFQPMDWDGDQFAGVVKGWYLQ